MTRPENTIRTSVLAKVRMLSLASLATFTDNTDGVAALKKLQAFITSHPQVATKMKRSFINALFVEVGLARNVRIDNDWATSLVHGIGSPDEPIIVPGNFQTNVTIEKLQLDARSLSSYMTNPKYWYDARTHREALKLESGDGNKISNFGNLAFYTYLVIDSKETNDETDEIEIYAILPKTESKNISSSDVMVVSNVSATGYKYSFNDFLNLITINAAGGGNGGGNGGGSANQAPAQTS